MSKKSSRLGVFPSADEDAVAAQRHVNSPQCTSGSYLLAFQDQNFLLREELRPVRLQLELLKPELALQEQQIESIVVIYGSARLTIVLPLYKSFKLEIISNSFSLSSSPVGSSKSFS